MDIKFQQIVEFLSSSPFFKQLDDGEKQRLAREFDVVSLPGGRFLLNQNMDADTLYFVLEGKLISSRRKNQRIVNECILQSGDPVGEEAFFASGVYRSSVKAITDAILLRIRKERISNLFDQYPRLSGSKSMFMSTQLLSRLVNLDWLNHDERIVLINRKNGFFLIKRVAIPCLAMLAGLIILILNLQRGNQLPTALMVGIAVIIAVMLLWLFWAALDWSNDYYILTTKRLLRVDRAVGLFDHREEIPLGNVMSVDVETDPAGKIIGYANIASRTYNVPMIWQGISNPDLVAGLIQEWAEKVKTEHADLEMSAMQAALDKQLGEVRSVAQDFQPVEEQPVPTPNKEIHSITFRKHWVILFRKTILPFILFVVAGFFLINNISGPMPVKMNESMLWLVGVVMILLLVWYLYQFMDWRNDIYQITADQIIDMKRTPLGKEDRKTAPLENILSINYRKRGLFGLLLNYGTVNIQVGTESLIFDYVRDPSGVQREIFRRIAERQSALRQANLYAERERMSQWIAAYHRRIND